MAEIPNPISLDPGLLAGSVPVVVVQVEQAPRRSFGGAIWRSHLLRTAGIYTTANAINAAVPFFLLPVFTRYMGPADYGLVAMFQVLVLLTGPFIGLNLQSAIGRQYVDRDRIDLPRYIANCLALFVASGAAVALGFWVFAKPVSYLATFPSQWLWAVFAYAAGQFPIQVRLTLWQMGGRVYSYVSFQMLQMVANVGLSLLLVVGLRQGWQGALRAQSCAFGAFGCVALLLLWRGKWIALGFDGGYMRHALRYGLPLIPHMIGGWLITMTDRLMIAHMIGLGEAGLYAVGYQIGMILSLMQNSFNQAWVPWLFENLKRSDGSPSGEQLKRKIVQFTYAYDAVMLIAVLLLAALAPTFLRHFVGPAFTSAGKFVFWIALGYGFNGMYKMVTNYIFYAHKTSILATVTLSTAVFNAAVCYAMLRWHGSIGAAQATALAFLLSFLGTWVLAARVYRMPWSLRAA